MRAWFLSQALAVPAPPPRVAAPLCRLRIALLVGGGGPRTSLGPGRGPCLGGSTGCVAEAEAPLTAAAAAAAAAAALGSDAGAEGEAEAMPEGLALCFGQLALLFATGGGQAN